MSISSNSAADAVVLAQGVTAHGKPAHTVAAPAAPAVAQKPVIKAEPLIDPDRIRENLQDAIAKLNQQVERNGRGLNFSLDERLNRPVITVRSTATGEVVRQIPNEVIVKVAHNIEDLKGLLMDQTL